MWCLHAWGCLERDSGKHQLARELFKAAIKVDPKSEKVSIRVVLREAQWRVWELQVTRPDLPLAKHGNVTVSQYLTV